MADTIFKIFKQKIAKGSGGKKGVKVGEEIVAIAEAQIKDPIVSAGGSGQIPEKIDETFEVGFSKDFISKLEIQKAFGSEMQVKVINTINKAVSGIQTVKAGDIITNTHHNTLKKAVGVLGQFLIIPNDFEVLTFDPNFLPVNQRLPQQFDWYVTFNKAVVPHDDKVNPANQGVPSIKGDNVKGAFSVQLPEGLDVAGLIVRGRKVGDKNAPKKFTVSLKVRPLDMEDEEELDGKSLISIDLKDKTGSFVEVETSKKLINNQINNSEYLYFIEAYWENNGNSAPFALNSIQVICKNTVYED